MKEVLSVIKSFLLIVFISTSATCSYGQNEILRITGHVVDEEYKKPLPGSEIHILRNGRRIGVKFLNDSAEYELELPLGFVYDFEFKCKGYSTKILRYETQNISPEDRIYGFEHDIKMELFQLKKGFDKRLLKEPIGIARFDSTENNIVFDLGYTEKIQSRIIEEQKRCASKKK